MIIKLRVIIRPASSRFSTEMLSNGSAVVRDVASYPSRYTYLHTRGLITAVDYEEKGFLGLISQWFFLYLGEKKTPTGAKRRRFSSIFRCPSFCGLEVSLEPHMRKDDNEVGRGDK